MGSVERSGRGDLKYECEVEGSWRTDLLVSVCGRQKEVSKAKQNQDMKLTRYKVDEVEWMPIIEEVEEEEDKEGES